MSESDRSEQVVLVTGASAGIGRSTVIELCAAGYRVYAAARRYDRLRELESHGARPVKMDITDEDNLLRIVDQITGESGGIHILVNNAGFGLFGAMEDTSIEDARYQFEVNFFGLARLTQLVLPFMRAQNMGKIVNISSMGGKVYMPLGSWYHATKHALEGWSDCLRIELQPFGIDVIVIEPGLIATEFGDVMVGPMLERSGESAYATLAHRLARATRNSYARGNGSPPEVIARVIARAIMAEKPRTRYPAGKFARLLMATRKWLGDRIYDRIVLRAI